MLSNIEAVARAICARQLQKPGKPASVLQAEVDHYWHCVAAELEGGLVDDEGNRLGPYDHEKGLAAYRDFVRRHKSK